MKKSLNIAIASLLALSLSACQTMGTKETLGTVGGAVAGGFAGAQFGKGNGQLVAVAAGTLAGALIGREIGVSLDRADQLYHEQAMSQAYSAPIRHTISWNNPRSGNSGMIRPIRDGVSAYGHYCREYQQTIIVGGQAQNAYGTACRLPDGSWQVAN